MRTGRQNCPPFRYKIGLTLFSGIVSSMRAPPLLPPNRQKPARTTIRGGRSGAVRPPKAAHNSLVEDKLGTPPTARAAGFTNTFGHSVTCGMEGQQPSAVSIGTRAVSFHKIASSQGVNAPNSRRHSGFHGATAQLTWVSGCTRREGASATALVECPGPRAGDLRQQPVDCQIGPESPTIE